MNSKAEVYRNIFKSTGFRSIMNGLAAKRKIIVEINHDTFLQRGELKNVRPEFQAQEIKRLRILSIT